MQVDYLSMSQTSAENEGRLIHAVRDRYRCPDGFLNLRLGGELSPDLGYFQFGNACHANASTSRGIYLTLVRDRRNP